MIRNSPPVRVLARPHSRSTLLRPSSKRSMLSRTSRNRSSGLRTLEKVLSQVSDMLSRMDAGGSGPGGWALCLCMVTDYVQTGER